MSQYFASAGRTENDVSTLSPDFTSWARSEVSLTPNLRVGVQTNRVTLKIDVPHTDHSHVIGRGGRNIKAVMLDTQCHIHFPDSNRTSTAEKSNQVSISGHVTRVDRARQRIRDILPIEFTFALPFEPISQPSVFRNSTFVRDLEDQQGVEVCFRNIYTLFDSHVVVNVKGLACNSRKTKAACQALLQRYYGPNAMIPVTMSIKMDPSYQVSFLGQKSPEDLSRLVFQATGALVTLQDTRQTAGSTADSSELSSPPPRTTPIPRLQHLNLVRKVRAKSVTLEISGTVDSVFLARQLISNLLPVTLMFCVSLEECELLKNLDLAQIGEQYDVTIDISNKLRQPARSLIIKTIEKNVRALYSTWELISGLIAQLAPTSVPSPLINMHGQREIIDNNCLIRTTDSIEKGLSGSRLTMLRPSDPTITISTYTSSPIRNSTLKERAISDELHNVLTHQLGTPPYSTEFNLDASGFEQNAQLRLKSTAAATNGVHQSVTSYNNENRQPSLGQLSTASLDPSLDENVRMRRLLYPFKTHPNYNPPPRAIRAAALAALFPGKTNQIT